MRPNAAVNAPSGHDKVNEFARKEGMNIFIKSRIQIAKETQYRTQDIDDENISVTGRSNSTSFSRCSSNYRSHSRSPPHPDDEGVLNLDTKSAKNAASSDDSSAFIGVKPKSPSEHQSRLEDAYQSSVEQPSSKVKSKKLGVADDVEPAPQVSPSEDDDFEKNPELFKNTKARKSTRKNNNAFESYVPGDKETMLRHRNYLDLELLKNSHHPMPPNVQFPFSHTNPEVLRFYPHFPYSYHAHSGSDPSHPLISPFLNYPLSQFFAPKFTSSTSPSRTSSPPIVGSQPFPGSRVEPVLQTSQPSVTPIH